MEQVKREVRIRIEAPPIQSPLQTPAERSASTESLPALYRVGLCTSFGFSLLSLYLALIAV